MENRVFVIAEIGCNHNGDINLAKVLVNKAKNAGVDAVKFQTFNSKRLISKHAPKAKYQIKTTGNEESQLAMTKKLELSFKDYMNLKKYAEDLGLIVFSTPFDMESIEFLESINQNIWKIPSGEITNLPYLKKISEIKCEHKKIILSTGMSTIQEIKTAVKVLNTKKNDIAILHCNTEYPTPDNDINITALNEIKNIFPNHKIGFSDHSVGSTAAIMAVSLGAKIIEKHFTLNKDLPGPDHHASATPEELNNLVIEIRRAEKMFGYNKKIITESEKNNKIIARKSIIANKNIKKGEIFTEENLTVKRPGNGISPMKWYDILGKEAMFNFSEDDLIVDPNFKWEESDE
ncbi:N-acetylneuraminate synthase [Facklamia sp. P12937]|uniref:N-acetylneuraminate synthase n=1 Tax=Facklamia sp. P12937 TaxID=3421949 RepID=UPI003D17FDD3